MRWGKGRIVAAALAWGFAFAASGPVPAAHAADGAEAAQEGGIRFGIDREEYEAQARAAMQVDPVVAAHLGAIRQVRLDEDASMAEPGPDVLVFDVEGSRGKGRITARFITVSPHEEALGPGTLAMADGTEHAIEGNADAVAHADARDGHDGHDGHDHEGTFDAGSGGDIFTRQAREAAQRYPLVRQHIGDIMRFDIDAAATGEAPGMDEFVFDMEGSKGRGRLLAEFITVDADTERLGKGVLTLADGREIPFEGEPPQPGEGSEAVRGGRIPDAFATQDGVFVKQARVAMQAHPLIVRHIGEIREARFDREASWALAGDRYAFDLTGSKGSGRLVAEFITVDADSEQLGEGELLMADGRSHTLEAP